MNKHPMDYAALFFGVAFSLIAGIVLVTQVSGADTDPGWGIAITSIVLGALVLVTTVVRGVTHERRTLDDEPEPVPAGATSDE